jgi:hypothetical protein
MMPVNVERTLRLALRKLMSERVRIERQIAALENVLSPDRTGTQRRRLAGKAPARKRMSAAARKAASRRMKAYWAKRRAERARKGRKSAT